MSHDYGEIFCDAVNQLIQSSLSTLNYDITKNCTVVNIDDRKYGKYQVSDGIIKFYAYASNDTFYELNDSVLVTIPEGDFNKQATIINKIADPLLGSVNYVNPFDTLLKGTGDIINTSITRSLSANDSKGVLESVITIDKKEFFGFTKVGLQADFSTLLKGQNIVSGAYGLKLMLYSEKNNKNSAIDFTFSSYDMFGNPYEFESFYKQQIVFDIPKDLNCIKKIEIYFYQDGNFKDGNGTMINPIDDMKNLFVRNIQLYFGYAADLKIEERVELSSPSLTYNDSTDKLIYLKWFHKVNENTLELIESSNWDEDKYPVRWYRYEPGCPESEIDEYGGQNWKWINPTTPNPYPYDYPFVFSFKPNLMNTSEKFKVIAFVNDHPLHNNPEHVVTTNYRSNILTFENSDVKTSGGATYVEDVVNKFSLHFDDGSDGNYFLYDQNGFLINSTEIVPAQDRTISLRYGGETITKDSSIFNDIKSITWEAPDPEELKSMIIYNHSDFKDPKNNLINNDTEKLGTPEGWEASLDNENWQVDSELQPSKHGENNIAKIKIPTDLSSDLYIFQDIENNTAGLYNFKTIVQVFNNVEDLEEEVRQQSAKIRLQVFISKDDRKTWDRYPSYSETFSIKCGSETKIKTSFKVFEEHTHLKIAIVYLKDQNFEVKPDISYQNFFIWLKDFTSFRLNSNFLTNTYYPSKDGTNIKEITSFTYQISSIWAHDRSNNFIQCSVNIGNEMYSFNETLRFGPKGSNGTHNTFLLEMLDGKNALIVDDEQQKNLRVKAILLDASNKEIKIDDPENIEWYIINFNKDHMELSSSEDSQICTIKKNDNLSTLPDNNYAILQAKYKPPNNTVSLYAFLPIPMKQAECVRMTGADRVIYNHLGTPSYSNVSYVAYMSNGATTTNWNLSAGSIEYGGKTYKSSNLPSLKISADGGNALVAAPLYSKGEGSGPICDAICVSCDYWSQPILIMQSNYDFAMLNEWDGSLTIDKENSIILATMLGAGRKNDKNEFSGVLIGDIKGGTNLNSADKMTGVYGFQNGAMSYALREDGTAFFGGVGGGRIEIDGTSGIIRSVGWKKKSESWILNPSEGNPDHDENIPVRSSGTLLDLDDGMLLMKSGDNYIYFNRPENPGVLEMSLSSVNIKLSDKSETPNLSQYIDDTTGTIVNSVTAKLDASASTETFGWIINLNDGFKIFKKVESETTDLFTVTPQGEATFSGSLDAVSGTFTSLTAGELIIDKETYKSSFQGGNITLAVGDTEKGTGGLLIIGSPDYKNWDDVTIKTQVIKENTTQNYYGNLGTNKDRWSLIYTDKLIHNTLASGSARILKKDIQIYDNEQAYYELKNMPLYTFKYKTPEPSLSIGTIIDYMPNEIMSSNQREDDGQTYNVGNALFWNIAASQAIQKRVEELQQEVIELKIKLEENNNGIN